MLCISQAVLMDIEQLSCMCRGAAVALALLKMLCCSMSVDRVLTEDTRMLFDTYVQRKQEEERRKREAEEQKRQAEQQKVGVDQQADVTKADAQACGSIEFAECSKK